MAHLKKSVLITVLFYGTFSAHAETIFSFDTKIMRTHGSAYAWSPDWAGTPKHLFTNDTSNDMVVKSISFRLTSAMPQSTRHYPLKSAEADVCVNIPLNPAFRPGGWPVSQNEVLCMTLAKSDKSKDWPQGDGGWWTINFPGQGHLLPAGTLLIVDSGVTTLAPSSVKAISQFNVKVVMDKVDASSSLPVFQSVRVPYIDEVYKSTAVSRTGYQSNGSDQVLKTGGVWIYNGTRGTQTKATIFQAGQVNTNASIDLNGNTAAWPDDVASHFGFQPWDTNLAPGDGMTMACTTTVPETWSARDKMARDNRICAFYLMLEVPHKFLITDSQRPASRKLLSPALTITQSQREAFCNNPYPANYIPTSNYITDYQVASSLSALEACRKILSEGSTLTWEAGFQKSAQ